MNKPLEERLVALYDHSQWTGRPRHRAIFMYGVAMLATACRPENVAKMDELADFFDARFSTTNACWEQSKNWVGETDDRYLLDSYLLWNWVTTTNGEYGKLSTIPHELYTRLSARVVRHYNNLIFKEIGPIRNGQSLTLEVQVPGGLIRNLAPTLANEFDLEICKHHLRLGALYDCAFDRASRTALLGQLLRARNGEHRRAVVGLAEAIRTNPLDVSLPGIYADALDDIGAEDAAKHMRTKTHCRSCWAVLEQQS